MNWSPLRRVSALFLATVVAVGCSSEPLSTDGNIDALLTASFDPPDGEVPGVGEGLPGLTAGVAELELMEICKLYVGAGPHPDAQFTIDVDRDNTGGRVDTSFVRSSADFVNDGGGGFQCLDVWNQGGLGSIVTVTETPLAGYTTTSTIDAVGGAVAPSAIGNVTTALIGGPIQGATAFFTNTLIPIGGEGCTPGYWKQSQHFDSWPAPYDPDDMFSDHFEDAFPGMTMVEVAGQGGGGLNALGRHTVAALLNGGSSVDYDLTAAGVIAAFNAVYPGSKGDYTALKNQFAGFNEQGCPLN